MQWSSTLEALDPEGVETRVLHNLVRLAGRNGLEIGSGNGRLTWCYAHRAASVVGVESEEGHVLRARAAAPPALRNRVDFSCSGRCQRRTARCGFRRGRVLVV